MRLSFTLCAMLLAFPALAADSLRVAVVGNAPPMSFVDASGRLTGFNAELARALCEALDQPCELKLHELQDVVGAVASGQVDFAVVSLLATPERRARILFTKPLYRSLSVWLSARPFPGASEPTPRVAVVRGSVQHAYGNSKGWNMAVLDTHTEVYGAVGAGAVQAALLPMTTGMNVIRDPRFSGLGWNYTLVSEAALSGDVALSVSPSQPKLLERLNEAIDKVKRNGRFDRINTEFLPFRLQ